MKLSSKSVAAVLVVALVATVGLVASSSAHKRLYNASITTTLNKLAGGDTISGKLTSNGACLPGRTVTVFEDVNTSVPGDTTEVGKTTTNSAGAWTLPIQGGIKKDRTYYSHVSKVGLVKSKRHKHICKGATSPPVIGT